MCYGEENMYVNKLKFPISFNGFLDNTPQWITLLWFKLCRIVRILFKNAGGKETKRIVIQFLNSEKLTKDFVALSTRWGKARQLICKLFFSYVCSIFFLLFLQTQTTVNIYQTSNYYKQGCYSLKFCLIWYVSI